MELLIIIAALASDPVRIDVRAAWFAGPAAPLVAPVEVLPPAARVRLILAQTRLGLGERVAAAIAWGGAVPGLRAALQHAGPLAVDPTLDAALRRWSDGECAILGLPADAAIAVIGADGRLRPSTADERGAIADAQELLAPLPWPLWRGPLLLVPYGVNHPAIAPGAARVARQALPVLRLPPGGRTPLAMATAELALALSAPPPAGWPGWLAAGVAACARARADGSGIPERPLSERRAAAGPDAVAALLRGENDDPALAMAVVGGLLHPNRRARLPDLLQRLREGATGPEAVAAAYRLSPAQLAGRPAGGPPPR